MKRLSLVLLLFFPAGNLYAQGTTGNELRVEVIRNWAEHNVKWVICPAEREVFGRLKSDLERKAFIDAFWHRRDPDPQTPLSEAKDEHYKRMDFADGHFRENEQRGSLTERGRVWIMYGPPQRREVHPRARNRVFSWEAWHYDRLPDIGENIDLEFTDRANRGEYRLSLSPEQRERLLTLRQCGETMVYRLP